jgi:competence protein ComEA
MEAFMASDKLNRLWLLATFLLLIVIIISGVVIFVKRDQRQSIIISDPTPSLFQSEIYIDGAVNSPGIYPLKETDSLNSLIQACGGIAADADMSTIRLYIPVTNETPKFQKIDINRAEVWLLQALPDIGETRALAIIDYRQQNGPFHSIQDLTLVKGISSTTFEKIKDLITVGE